jgi:hypothetical protein
MVCLFLLKNAQDIQGLRNLKLHECLNLISFFMLGFWGDLPSLFSKVMILMVCLIFPIYSPFGWYGVTEQGVTARICPITVHCVWIPEWLIRTNPAASLMRATDLIFFRGGASSDCAWDAWGSSFLVVWDGIAGRWRRDWWSWCGATLMNDGGGCGGEEIWNEGGL